MEQDKRIPDIVIKRLPVYYRFLTSLRQAGISRVSSRDLGDTMGITSSQVRQDFSKFGSFGLQGYGYDVDQLRNEIGKILGLGKKRNMIIIGAGHLGQALARHSAFERDGYVTVGIFDVDRQILGEKIRDIEVMHMDTLTKQFVHDKAVDIAIITVPYVYARETADLVTELGIRGIWNFTSVKLDAPPGICVEDIHLSDSLMTLGYYMGEADDKQNVERK